VTRETILALVHRDDAAAAFSGVGDAGGRLFPLEISSYIHSDLTFILPLEVVDNLVNGSIEICGDPPNPMALYALLKISALRSY
jgi:hypothetical protein